MRRTPLNVKPPSWLKIDNDSYKRLLNRTAVAMTKRAKKQGGTYQVKEVMEAIHEAFHRCEGTDPIDGLPLDGQHLKGTRSPTVCPVDSTNITSFEILSLQTKESKGSMRVEEFIDHCRAVVAHADSRPAGIDSTVTSKNKSG